jgi:hypothetical protein
MRRVAPYCTAIMMIFSSFWIVCQVTPGWSVSVGTLCTVMLVSAVLLVVVVWLLSSAVVSVGVRLGSIVGVGQGISITCPCWILAASRRLFNSTTMLIIGSWSRWPQRMRMAISVSPACISWVHGLCVGVIVGDGGTVSVGEPWVTVASWMVFSLGGVI